MSETAFVGRQAIVDRDRRVVAYELLYRRGRGSVVADYDEQSIAAVRVIANTFASLGEETVLGGLVGFFNVTREVFLSDAIHALPKERVVVELLENVEPDREIERRCRALREAGYSIALDDWVLDDPRVNLLPFVDVVKVDLPAVGLRPVRRVARMLRDAGKLTLAEKVETQAEFEACVKAGFDRFQGYFFARPVVVEGALLDPGQTTLMRLLQQLSVGASTAAIVESFKQDAKLGVNLIRIVNTAGHAGRLRIESIEDGVRHLGVAHLSRWVSVLLFAQGRKAGVRDPLLTLAAHRGRLMELVAEDAARGGRLALDRERAFLVGMLSLVDALLGRPLEAIVDELSLAPELAEALLRREGDLGRLLGLAEAAERGDVGAIESGLAWLGLPLEKFQAHEHAVYAWIHALQQSLSA
ncbi:EAL domain-containing protein [Myxococcota bacterium]|nr:EAL domain-containing protein [Myxococcota bacterium]